MNKSEVISVRISPKTKIKLKKIAQKSRRPFCSLCSIILEDFADKGNEKNTTNTK